MTEGIEEWLGKWSGTKRLWRTPDSEELGSNTQVGIKRILGGKFMEIEYSWKIEGEPQSGLIIFPANISEKEAHSVWLDSWHTSHNMMVCVASNLEDKLSMLGTYPAPPGDDWGWRLELSQGSSGNLLIQMFNLSPECEECLAVEMELTPLS